MRALWATPRGRPWARREKGSIVGRVPAWDLKRASEFASACFDHGIEWLEEPLDSRDYDGSAALKKMSKVKISGAELNYGWDEIKIMLEKDCFDVYQPDATFAGGIAQVKKVMDACREKDRLFSPHTWTNGVGFYVNWNMSLADKENRLPLEYPLEEPSWIPEFREAIIDPILPDENGMLQPFKRPGLGFQVHGFFMQCWVSPWNNGCVAVYQVRRIKMTISQVSWALPNLRNIVNGPRLAPSSTPTMSSPLAPRCWKAG